MRAFITKISGITLLALSLYLLYNILLAISIWPEISNGKPIPLAVSTSAITLIAVLVLSVIFIKNRTLRTLQLIRKNL